ncbi:TPA: hypothetical protein NIH31_002366 [Pseudomonas aeruginosa]|nr:hypothetical protein [Pseudomonas aeruginosa]
MAFWILSMLAMAIAVHIGFLCGKRQRQPVSPVDLIDIQPMPYVAFAPGSRKEERIAFLKCILKGLEGGVSVSTARPDQEAGGDA